MLPIVIEWQEPDFTYYASQQTFTNDVPVTLNNVVNVPSFSPTGSDAFYGQTPYTNNLPLIFNNAGTGVPDIQLGSYTSYVPTPPNTVRGLLFHQAGGGGFATFELNGADQYGNIQSEVVSVNVNSSTESALTYAKVFSIIPDVSSISGGTIEIGLGYVGATLPPMLDTYNKNSLYTLSYTNVDGGTTGTKVTPYFTTDPILEFIDRQQVYTQFTTGNSFVFPITNANVICTSSTGAAAIPFTINNDNTASLSFSSIPLTSIYTVVNGTSTYNSGFVQTIIQQGARR